MSVLSFLERVARDMPSAVAVEVLSAENSGLCVQRAELFSAAKDGKPPSRVSAANSARALDAAIEAHLNVRYGVVHFNLAAVDAAGRVIGSEPEIRNGRAGAPAHQQTDVAQLTESVAAALKVLTDAAGNLLREARIDHREVKEGYQEHNKRLIAENADLHNALLRARQTTSDLFDHSLLLRAKVQGFEPAAPQQLGPGAPDQLKAKLDAVMSTLGPMFAFVGPSVAELVQAIATRLRVSSVPPPQNPSREGEPARVARHPAVQPTVDAAAMLSDRDILAMGTCFWALDRAPEILRVIVDPLNPLQQQQVFAAFRALLSAADAGHVSKQTEAKIDAENAQPSPAQGSH